MGPDSRTLAFYLCGASQQDADLYVMINASDRDETFEIQEGQPGEWRRVFDTGLASPDDFHEPGGRACIRCFILRRPLPLRRRPGSWRCVKTPTRTTLARSGSRLLLLGRKVHKFNLFPQPQRREAVGFHPFANSRLHALRVSLG